MFKYSFFRYGLVGVYSVILDYALLYVFFSLFNIDKNITITCAFFGSSVFNFFMHKRYTFKSHRAINKELYKYIGLVFVSYFITIYLINCLIELNINIYLAKLFTVIVVFIYGYFISKLFIYKGKKCQD
jgi:putative flippase GtrA